MLVPTPSMYTLVNRAKHTFRREFKKEANIAVYCPGKCHLMGDCMDYSDSITLSMTIPGVVVMVGRKTKDESSTIIILPKMDNPFYIEHPWIEQIRDVVQEFQTKWKNPNFHLIVSSSIPEGCGLGEDVALQVCTHYFLEKVTGTSKKPLKVDILERAINCYTIDKTLGKLHSSIADPITCMVSKKNHFSFIDPVINKQELIPLDIKYCILLFNTTQIMMETLDNANETDNTENTIKPPTSDSPYVSLEGKSFRDKGLLSEIQSKVSPTIFKRISHVVGELNRTEVVAKLLKEYNPEKIDPKSIKLLQQTMRDSQDSLLEIIPNKVITDLTTIVGKAKGILGCRWSGFPNCLIAVIEEKEIGALMNKLKKPYPVGLYIYKFRPEDSFGECPTSSCKCDLNPLKQCNALNSSSSSAICQCSHFNSEK